jgi:ferrous iron transport protein A
MSSLSAGETGRIVAVTNEGAIRRRLMDIGFTEGTRVACLRRSPLGDPTAFAVKGAVIALRRGDAAGIYVETEGRGSWD